MTKTTESKMNQSAKKADPRAAIRAILEAAMAVADAIRELGTVPSGVLYAQVASVLTLDDFLFIVRNLKEAGVVAESNHVLRWTGPAWGGK